MRQGTLHDCKALKLTPTGNQRHGASNSNSGNQVKRKRQGTLHDCKKVVVLERGSTALVFSSQDILNVARQLHPDSNTPQQILTALGQLSSYILTVEHLKDTKVGHLVKKLKTHSDVNVARVACNLCKKWKSIAMSESTADRASGRGVGTSQQRGVCSTSGGSNRPAATGTGPGGSRAGPASNTSTSSSRWYPPNHPLSRPRSGQPIQLQECEILPPSRPPSATNQSAANHGQPSPASLANTSRGSLLSRDSWPSDQIFFHQDNRPTGDVGNVFSQRQDDAPSTNPMAVHQPNHSHVANQVASGYHTPSHRSASSPSGQNATDQFNPFPTNRSAFNHPSLTLSGKVESHQGSRSSYKDQIASHHRNDPSLSNQNASLHRYLSPSIQNASHHHHPSPTTQHTTLQRNPSPANQNTSYHRNPSPTNQNTSYHSNPSPTNQNTSYHRNPSPTTQHTSYHRNPSPTNQNTSYHRNPSPTNRNTSYRPNPSSTNQKPSFQRNPSPTDQNTSYRCNPSPPNQNFACHEDASPPMDKVLTQVWEPSPSLRSFTSQHPEKDLLASEIDTQRRSVGIQAIQSALLSDAPANSHSNILKIASSIESDIFDRVVPDCGMSEYCLRYKQVSHLLRDIAELRDDVLQGSIPNTVLLQMAFK